MCVALPLSRVSGVGRTALPISRASIVGIGKAATATNYNRLLRHHDPEEHKHQQREFYKKRLEEFGWDELGCERGGHDTSSNVNNKSTFHQQIIYSPPSIPSLWQVER